MIAIIVAVVPFLELLDGIPVLDPLSNPDAEGPKGAASSKGHEPRRGFLARGLAPATHHLAGDGAANNALKEMSPVLISVFVAVTVSVPVEALVPVFVDVHLFVVATATARAPANLAVVLLEVVVASTADDVIAALMFVFVVVVVLVASLWASGNLSVFNDLSLVHDVVRLIPLTDDNLSRGRLADDDRLRGNFADDDGCRILGAREVFRGLGVSVGLVGARGRQML
jgi:hypothetical protein